MTAATRQGDNLDPTELIAEETLPGYDPADYYPVRLGEVLGGKYRVISKLGFGSRSTVWLCRDESHPSPEYVAVKAYINQIQSNSELEAYLHLDTLPSQHQGQAYVRKAYDYFELESPHRKHLCLVQEPLGVSLGDVLNRIQRGPLEAPAVRYIIRRVLKALDYLHTEANIVHTDVTPNNVLLAVEDKTLFQKMEQSEIEKPTPQKVLQDRLLYPSRLINRLTSGTPILCDLSEARTGDTEHRGYIMCDPYRAPEVILGMSWSSAVDIWSVGLMTWDLLEAKHLLTGRDAEGRYSEEIHLAQMVKIMGLPRPGFLERAERNANFFDAQGWWTAETSIPTTSLATLVSKIADEEKVAFVRFLSRMIQWRPEDRPSARELLSDEWML